MAVAVVSSSPDTAVVVELTDEELDELVAVGPAEMDGMLGGHVGTACAKLASAAAGRQP